MNTMASKTYVKYDEAYWSKRFVGDKFVNDMNIIALELGIGDGRGNFCSEAMSYDEVVLQTIAMEASGEDSFGQFLVAKVILNRARMRNISPREVVLQRKQFSCWNDRNKAKAWLDKHYTPKVRLGASNALFKAYNEDSFNAITHYHGTGILPYWAKGHLPVIVHGRHQFYKDIK